MNDRGRQIKTNTDRIPMQPGIYDFCIADLDQIPFGKKIQEQEPERQGQKEQREKGKDKKKQIRTDQDRQNTVKIEIKNLLSDQGITCIAYEGILLSNNRKVVVKEFYPYSFRNIWGITRNSGNQKLHIPSVVWKDGGSAPTELESRFHQFVRSYKWQKKFYSDPRFLEIVVEPEYLVSYGDTYYIISDFHNGESLREKMGWFGNFQKKLFLMLYLADLMTILEKNGFMLLDISLDNFLVINQTENHYQLRLFDLDSILNLNEIDRLHRAEGNIFYHEEYASREIRNLEGILRRHSFDEIKKDYIEKSAAVYSLGVLFFRILFGHVPDQKERFEEKCREDMFRCLTRRLVSNYDITLDAADELMNLLKNMFSEQWERYLSGFYSCEKIREFLDDFYRKMHYEAYISQSEMANANDTFAAYNMLQKFPMFRYACGAREGSGKRILKAALVGKHRMRNGFLSAVLSIGQMLDTDLEIAVLSPDAEQFWNEYTEQNAGLRQAVRVEIDGKQLPDCLDCNLVGSPLASIRILNEEAGQGITKLYEEEYRYFALLDSEVAVLKMAEALYRSAKGANCPRICVGCLQKSGYLANQEEYKEKMDLHIISRNNVSEMYSEKMYREQIYQMGLMAHAYYRGVMNHVSGEDTWDRTETEQDYRKNIYNIMSSERAALHGIYKMGSVGIDIGQPGKFRAYFEKLNDEQIVERLGWLEHRSWTAYMLSAGHRPAAVEEMDSYAYQEGNDWKDKRDPQKIRHPLLVSSEPVKRLPPDNWQEMTKEEADKLDPLDKVSYDIYRWYCRHKSVVMKELEELFSDMLKTADLELLPALRDLCQCSRECAEHMGEHPNHQDQTCRVNWERAVKVVKDKLDGRERSRSTVSVREQMEKLQQIMKPVQDSYRNRDFKQLDRDIVYSVLDLIVV